MGINDIFIFRLFSQVNKQCIYKNLINTNQLSVNEDICVINKFK
jgi:hypothetical protein